MTLADTIIHGTHDDVEQAINAGEDIHQLDEYGFNPMVEAAIVGKPDVAELLLQKGCYVDMPDTTGRTALHWATDNHDMRLCKLLLDHDANPNAYSFTSQPVLTYPYLRKQTDLKNLLYQYGASLNFTQDFVNAKLLGHRFSLPEQTHIVNTEGDFILVDFEGFMFEFTSSLIQDSLDRFKNNFAAKHLHDYFKKADRMIEALKTAAKLIKYQQFSVKIQEHEKKINAMLQQELLLIPMVYPGHAVSAIKFRDIFIKCDRGEYGRNNNTIIVYKIHKPKTFNKTLIKKILYKPNTEHFIHHGLNDLVGLEPIYTLPVEPQLTGNCSWANVEATIPAMLFTLFLEEIGSIHTHDLQKIKKLSMGFFNEWLVWDQDRAIENCIFSFYSADAKRKATKAQILAAILVLRCHYENEKDIERAGKIMPILRSAGYEYILKTYIKEYTRDKKNPLGQNLRHLLDIVPYE